MSKLKSITTKDQNALPPHRKVFMITEKSADDVASTNATKASGGSKRKMILILDEKPNQKQTITENQQNQQHISSNGKMIKIENEQSNCSSATDAAPKLFIFANTVDNQISQKIEEILPEILNRFQWKNGRVVDVNDGGGGDNGSLKKNANNNTNGNTKLKHANPRQNMQNVINGTHQHNLNVVNGNRNNKDLLMNMKREYINNCNNSNLMLLGAAAAATAANSIISEQEDTRKITLPPKKNLSKLQKQLNHNSNNSVNNTNNCNNNNIHEHFCNSNYNDSNEVIAAATPVIVSATSLKSKSFNQQQQLNNHVNNTIKHHHQHNLQHSSIGQESNKNHNCLKGTNNINNNNNNKNNTNDSIENSIVVQQQNINLTGDFLFLMKMLPMLEKTPEPRKSQVKMLIEKIMKQCVGDKSHSHDE